MNAPTTYNMTVDTSQLTVTMIGPKSQIEQLSAADLTVTVNLLGAPQMEGDTVSFSYTPTISCENGIVFGQWETIRIRFMSKGEKG